MEQKKDLAKIALTALILAAAAPAHALADSGFEAQGTYLAAGCKAHGCGSIADNAPASADIYNSRSNTYQASGQPSMTDAQNTMTAATLTEAQLLGMLNPQTRSIYLGLNPEGKALAIQLASQDSYKDKNLAVKEAQRRISERAGPVDR